MIDWVTFIDSMDEDNFEEICNAVHVRKVDEAEALAQTIVLSFTEVNIARENPPRAVHMVMHRLRCGFLVAKTAVQMVHESDEEEAASRADDDGWSPSEDAIPFGEAADDVSETVIGIDQALVD
jgi:hypothetical protein